MEITFEYAGKKITAYQFTLGGEDLIGLSCDTLTELRLIQELGIMMLYPEMGLTDFALRLQTAGIKTDLPEIFGRG